MTIKPPPGTSQLNFHSPTFAEDFATLLGIAPGDTIEFIGPQFTRTDGVNVQPPPTTPEGWANLAVISRDELFAMGIGLWAETDDYTHFLFPGEWFNFIPEGLPMVCINGQEETFSRVDSDNDTRYGCLAYGFLRY